MKKITTLFILLFSAITHAAPVRCTNQACIETKSNEIKQMSDKIRALPNFNESEQGRMYDMAMNFRTALNMCYVNKQDDYACIGKQHDELLTGLNGIYARMTGKPVVAKKIERPVATATDVNIRVNEFRSGSAASLVSFQSQSDGVLEIKNVVVNRGNCKDHPDNKAMYPMYLKFGDISPKLFFNCTNVIEMVVVTNAGSMTFTLKQ